MEFTNNNNNQYDNYPYQYNENQLSNMKDYIDNHNNNNPNNNHNNNNNH